MHSATQAQRRAPWLWQQMKLRVLRFPRTFVSLLAVTALLLSVYAAISVRVVRRADEQVQRQMQDAVEMQKDLARLYLDGCRNSCAHNALSLAGMTTGNANEALLIELRALPKDEGCLGMILYDPEADRTFGAFALPEIQRDYLRASPPNRAVVLPWSDETGARQFAVAAPVRIAGTPTRFLVAIYHSDGLGTLLANTPFGAQGKCSVLTRDGRYVALSHTPASYPESFFDNEHVTMEDGLTSEALRADFRLGASRLFHFRNSTGVESFGYYTPLGVRDWYVLSTVRRDVAEGSTRANQSDMLWLIIASVIGFAVVLAMVLYESQRHKRALRSSNRSARLAQQMMTRVLSEADCLAFFYSPGEGRAELLNDVDAPDRERLETGLFAPQQGDDLVLPEDAPRHARLLKQLDQLQTPDPLVLLLKLFPAAQEYRFCKLTFALAEDAQGAPMYLCAVKDEDSVRREVLTLRELSRRDGLTRLYNRRACVELINEQLTRRGQGTFIYLDLDDFKQINDSQGHVAGDAALTRFAAAFRTAFVLSDILARLGGDEFAVFSPYFISEGNARKHLEKLQQELSRDGSTLSFSAGVVFARPGDDFDTLYHIADEALYAAKEAGKCRFVFAERE